MNRIWFRKAVCAGWLLAALSVSAQDPDALFLEVIQPALEQNCTGCHGEGQAMAKLDLRSRQAILAGGLGGPALIPGSPEESPLYTSVTGSGKVQMPPGGAAKRLPAEVIEAIRHWIEAGAPWPETGSESQKGWGTYAEEDLWAFRPLRETFQHSSIDGFIDAGLAVKGLQGAPLADRRTLIRRVTINLTGLPPTPEEVRGFVEDGSGQAWENAVDRLLASPRYGERWGRHWLDVVRYADTSGYSNDFERPNAWRYRDYVIRSFNENKPYDRFVQEQIAGDELFPGDPEALLATGFLRSGPWEHTGMAVEAETRQMFLDDVTHNTASVFMGVTLGCAKCHDHKFDPIPALDYYRMQAVFATTEFARPALPFLPSENTADFQVGRKRLNEVMRSTDERMSAMKDLITKRLAAKLGVAPGDLSEAQLREALRKLEGLTPAEYEEYKLHQKHLQLYRESLDRYEPKAFAVSSGPRDGETDGGSSLKYPKRAEYKAPEVHVLTGGSIQSPAGKAPPGLLSLAGRYAGLAEPEVAEAVEDRRAVLAKWITDPRHPLTARVMVNRVWQYHFGRGLAADTSNFGKTGRKPTHPELLDWLARSFIESGWDLKRLHRTILMSETYRRSGEHPAMAGVRAADPENTLWAHFPPRRVEAEVIRDSMLSLSGELSPDRGGPGVFPQINEDVARQPRHAMGSLQPAYYPSARKRERNRRAIYTFQQRSLIDPTIEVLNGPSMDLSCERRETSTAPTQAFALFNGQFAHDMALAFAARLQREASSPGERIALAFRMAYGRDANEREMRLSLEHLVRMTAHHAAVAPPARAAPKPIVHTITSELTGEQFEFIQQPDDSGLEPNLHPSEVAPETRALADFALAIFNSNEFVYMY